MATSRGDGFLVFLVGLLTVAGCSSAPSSDPDAGFADAGADVDPDPPAALSRLPDVSHLSDGELGYSSLYADHLSTTCAKLGCHEQSGFGIGSMINLTFTEPAAGYRQLVGAPSLGKPGWLRVAPGEPERSYLIAKLLGDPVIEQSIMPRPPAEPLPDREIARFAEWIRRGALDDGSDAAPPSQ